MAEDDQPTEDAFDALLRQTLHGALDAVPVPADWSALAARLAAHRPPQVATTPRSASPQPPVAPQDAAYRPPGEGAARGG